MQGRARDCAGEGVVLAAGTRREGVDIAARGEFGGTSLGRGADDPLAADGKTPGRSGREFGQAGCESGRVLGVVVRATASVGDATQLGAGIVVDREAHRVDLQVNAILDEFAHDGAGVWHAGLLAVGDEHDGPLADGTEVPDAFGERVRDRRMTHGLEPCDARGESSLVEGGDGCDELGVGAGFGGRLGALDRRSVDAQTDGRGGGEAVDDGGEGLLGGLDLGEARWVRLIHRTRRVEHQEELVWWRLLGGCARRADGAECAHCAHGGKAEHSGKERSEGHHEGGACGRHEAP